MPRMGDSRDSSSNVDMAVGTIVWVRRRNGSWWPGRIISDAELSTANLLSPRSGTPVKLLGREDGSVDWYNIEKSRRVKAFRCGDFEESIEKAKAGAGLPTKKREKYARREDAILHALKLEKQQLESGYVETSAYRGASHEGHHNHREYTNSVGVGGGKPRSRRKRKTSKQASSSMDEEEEDDDDDDEDDDEEEESLDSQIYADDDDDSGEPSSSGRGQDDEQDWDPDDDEEFELPRMRGLQDFGLKTAAARRLTLQQDGKPLNGTVYVSTPPRKKRTGPPVDEGSLRKRRKGIARVLETGFGPDDNGSEFMDIVDDGTLLVGNPNGMESMGLEFTTTPASSSLSRNTNTECSAADMTNDIKWENGYYSRTLYVDIPVQEQKSSPKETVPMVLLASRLTKKPIVGYPVVIEALEAGFRQQLVGGWRTARRTARQRTPRQCPEGSNKDNNRQLVLHQESDQQHQEQQQQQQDGDIPLPFAKQVVRKAPLSVSIGNVRKRAAGNNMINNNRHKENLSKRLIKKVVQSSRKTRMLSSIGTFEEQDEEWNQDFDDDELATATAAAADSRTSDDTLFTKLQHQLQQEEGCCPVETCIPVRVALSRIKAAVNEIG